MLLRNNVQIRPILGLSLDAGNYGIVNYKNWLGQWNGGRLQKEAVLGLLTHHTIFLSQTNELKFRYKLILLCLRCRGFGFTNMKITLIWFNFYLINAEFFSLSLKPLNNETLVEQRFSYWGNSASPSSCYVSFLSKPNCLIVALKLLPSHITVFQII